jgi:tripartite-type tricarboxylate transporter receptor subunit TctC
MDYLMLRGIFMAPGVTEAQRNYYVSLFGRVREMPEWKDFMEKGAFNQTALKGDDYRDWVAKEESRHYQLMKEAGFLAPGK